MTERAGPRPSALGARPRPDAASPESADYVELHCHSSFSLLDGASPPEALVARAHALGHRALALTDHDDLGGIVRFAQASAEVGIGGIVGAELTVTEGETRDEGREPPAEGRAPSAERRPSTAERRAPSAERQPSQGPPSHHLVLLAETRAGYANLSTLVTRARMDAPRGFPRVPLELVARHADGLVALTGCPRGWVPSLLAAGREDEARRAAGTLAEMFGGRLAIEAWDHGLPEERATVAGLLRVARALDLPWVVTNDVHYAEPRGRVVHDVLQCLRHQRSLDEMGTRLRPSGEWSLRSAAAMRRRWRHDLAGVRETLAVAERCAFRLEHLRPSLPAFPLPPGVTPDEYLARLVEQGAHERWGAPGTARRTEKHDRQLAHELALIGRLGLAGYFLIVWDIVRFASREGILCQGRGSAANSAVCYCLGITAVDPIRLELLFERFLSEERQEAPDIDIDFAHDDRERVLQYVYERYGREHAAMVCEQITYRGRSAVRDAARVLGFSVEQADALSLLSDRFSAKATAERLRGGPSDGGRSALGARRSADDESTGAEAEIGTQAAVAQALGDGMVRGTEATTRARAVTEAMRKEMLRGPATRADARADEREAKLVAANAGRPLTSRDRPRPIAAYEPYGSPSAQHARSAREYATPSAMPGRPAEGRGPRAEGRAPHEDPHAEPTHNERRNPTTAMRETGVDADAILERAGLDPSDHRVRVLADIVEGLHQLPRHRSIHVGGFVLTAEPLSSVVPIEPASMPGRTVIQWEKDDLDPVGLVKIDLLGLGMLSVLQRCMRYVRETRGVTLDLGQLDTTDQAVYDDLCRADTVGVFQVESRAQMNTLPRLKPRCFYDLVVEVALIRPGPIQGEMVHPYLRRRAGVEAVTYPHPSLEPILKRTLGVPLFQEQGMQVAITAAGFTPGEADTLRRAMGHKRSRERMAAICRKMIDGMMANGFDEATAMRVYNQINAFADYGFPESHAASFALIVYASAYLRHYYAPEFTAAMLNSQPMGFYAPGTLIEDARRHGVVVAPVDLTRSRWDCTLESGGSALGARRSATTPGPRAQGPGPIPPAPVLRLGLRTIRGLGSRARERLEAGLADGAFASVEDVVRRSGLDRRALRHLAEAGAFDAMFADVAPAERRRRALWAVLEAAHGEAGPLAPSAPTPVPAALPAMRAAEITEADYRLTGISLAGHPMKHVRPLLEMNRVLTTREALRQRDGTRAGVGGLVICRQRPGTAKGFVFLTLEDETGMLNVVVTPKRFEAQALLISTTPLLLVRGVLQVESGVVNLRGERFHALDAKAGEEWARGRNFH